MIRLLSPETINKIAAGEVIERPASIVKELLENAIDASATKIEMDIEDGGKKLIQVKDNGSGMNEEDAKLCLLRHATSKIRSADDLFSLETFGFRGEALASIASVSQCSIETKQSGTLQGLRVSLNDSFEPVIFPVALNPGTVVSVRNLFYNVPARQKFLKSPATEFSHILRTVQQFALQNSNLELTLTHNGKKVLHVQPSDPRLRVEMILGKEFEQELLPCEMEEESLQVKGYLSKPTFVFSAHKNQYLFVNQRPVYDSLIARSVLEAYETLIPRGYFPAFVLSISLPPSEVDVNVHPRKTEVKFRNPFQVMSVLQRAVRSALKRENLIPKVSFSFAKPSSASGSFSIPSVSKTSFSFPQTYSGSISSLKRSPLEEHGWYVIGQIHRSFILVETPEGLQLMDQHAVSEITNFQKLLQEKKAGAFSSQSMLFPLSVELSFEEKSIVDEYVELFLKLGWDLAPMDSKQYQISAIPSLLKIENMKEIFLDFLSKLKEEKIPDRSDREMELLKYEACRSAVMFGDNLSREEMVSLLNQWLQVENNAACEHGRPAAAMITVSELKKLFHR